MSNPVRISLLPKEMLGRRFQYAFLSLGIDIVYINYENYMKKDSSKFYREIATLKANIKREKQIQDDNQTKEYLRVNYNRIAFDGKKYSYSKAMGEMQNQINKAAKDTCDVTRIKWAQVANTKKWYDKLRMNVLISCSVKSLFLFTNRLKKSGMIYVTENMRVTRDTKKSLLNINMQLVAFRVHK